MLRSPIVWFGGKGCVGTKRRILDLLPPHDGYLEPFGGGASVLIAKKPVGQEVYNDLDGALVDFFRVLADPVLFPHFWSRVRLLPYSREYWHECLRTWQGTIDPLERAVRWFVVARQSFAGAFGSSWGTTVSAENQGRPWSWQSILADLPLIHQRLQRVQIEHCDFRRCLERYHGNGYLAYCDPPYAPSTRKSGRYHCELTDADHRDLVKILLTYDGAVVLSGYRTDMYAPLEKAGWARTDWQVVCSAAGRTAASGLKGAGKCLLNQRRTESVWRNPECLRRIDGRTNRSSRSRRAPPETA